MNQPARSANTTALILLRIGFITCALFTAIFLLLTQWGEASISKPLTFVVAAIGLYFLGGAMRALLHELNPPQTTMKDARLSIDH